MKYYFDFTVRFNGVFDDSNFGPRSIYIEHFYIVASTELCQTRVLLSFKIEQLPLRQTSILLFL